MIGSDGAIADSTGSGNQVIRVALVTQGFHFGGGIPATARWLKAGLESTGMYAVDIHDLANRRNDQHSRRLLSPRSWFRRSLKGPNTLNAQAWGANIVEIEAMRYRPRRELSKQLNQYDLVHVVAGTPALAGVVRNAQVPSFLLAASITEWERPSILAAQSGALACWRRAMSRLTARADLRGLRGVDSVLVLNTRMFDHVKSIGQPNVLVAPPGVDTHLFSPNPDGWQMGGHLISVCRLAETRKGLDRMVTAYAALLRIHPDAPKLVLAGKGELSEPVVRLIGELGVSDRIDVKSDVPFEELRALMREGSVFLQTSHEEGLGISTLEAMASGLPVVSTDTAGSRETVVHGETGWLVSQYTEDDLAVAMARRIQSVLTTDGHAMSVKARARCVEVFEKTEVLGRVTGAYSNVLSSSASNYE